MFLRLFSGKAGSSHQNGKIKNWNELTPLPEYLTIVAAQNRHKELFNPCLKQIQSVPLIESKKPLPSPVLRRELNIWEKISLREIKDLSPEMLINLHENGTTFTKEHQVALRNLVSDGFKLQDALNILQDLSSSQAYGITHGLDRYEVKMLTNFWHIVALLNFKPFLTARMLRDHDEGEYKFEKAHVEAINYLINKQCYSGELALTTIEKLSPEQAKGIAKGLTREDILSPYEEKETYSFKP